MKTKKNVNRIVHILTICAMVSTFLFGGVLVAYAAPPSSYLWKT